MALDKMPSVSGQYLYPSIACVILLVVVTSYIISWSRLRHFPGPTLAAWSSLYMFRICTSGKQAESYVNMNKRYNSPLVRIGPNDLITDDPEMIRRMNGARSTYRRSSWYNAMRMDPYDDALFSMRDTAKHDKLKAKLSFGYGGKENPGLEQGIDEQLVALVRLLRRKYISTDGILTPLDLATRVQYFTLDVITKIAYGEAAGYLATDSDPVGYIQAAEELVPMLVIMAEMPLVGSILLNPRILSLVGPKKTDSKGIGKILGMAEKLVAKRFAPDAEDQLDMMGSFVRHGVSQRQCQTEVPFQIIAGSDTTATAIRGTMLYLISSPLAYRKLQDEIDSAIAEGRVSSPVKAEEGKRLQYLQAVIYEGMRMHIPFSGLAMKQSPPEGDSYNGMFIPGGTRIAHNTLGIQRRADIFGDDVEVFRPERWLGIEPEKKTAMTSAVEMVFGYGRWGCGGKPVAFLELNKVYVELLRYFDFQLIDPKNALHQKNINMFFESNMWVKVTERAIKSS